MIYIYKHLLCIKPLTFCKRPFHIHAVTDLPLWPRTADHDRDTNSRIIIDSQRECNDYIYKYIYVYISDWQIMKKTENIVWLENVCPHFHLCICTNCTHNYRFWSSLVNFWGAIICWVPWVLFTPAVYFNQSLHPVLLNFLQCKINPNKSLCFWCCVKATAHCFVPVKHQIWEAVVVFITCAYLLDRNASLAPF